MWIFTPSGYVSGVEDKRDPTVIVVRSRDHASLRAMCAVLEIKASKIKLGEGTDYPYRVRVSRQQFATFAYESAFEIDYTNFKDAATRARGDTYHDVLLRIWSATFSLTPMRVKRKLRARTNAQWRSIDSVLGWRLPDEDARPLHALTDAEWAELESGDPR